MINFARIQCMSELNTTEDNCLLGYWGQKSRGNSPTFQRCLTFIIKAMIMEAASTSDTSVNSYEITQRNVPEGVDLHTWGGEDLNSHQEFAVLFLM
jgi:hypothetical protein